MIVAAGARAVGDANAVYYRLSSSPILPSARMRSGTELSVSICSTHYRSDMFHVLVHVCTSWANESWFNKS